jgi:hypothetical protein
MKRDLFIVVLHGHIFFTCTLVSNNTYSRSSTQSTNVPHKRTCHMNLNSGALDYFVSFLLLEFLLIRVFSVVDLFLFYIFCKCFRGPALLIIVGRLAAWFWLRKCLTKGGREMGRRPFWQRKGYSSVTFTATCFGYLVDPASNICLSQGLSHASVSIRNFTTKLRIARLNSYSFFDGTYFSDNRSNSRANTCQNAR